MPAGFTSTACRNCKLKRRKCDQKWPRCTQCIRKRIECPGPSSLIKFVNTGQELTAGAHPAESSGLPEPSESSKVMVTRGPFKPYGAQGGLKGSFRLRAPRSAMSTVTDRVGAQLIGLFEVKGISDFGNCDFIDSCPQRLSQSSCLLDCVAMYCEAWTQCLRREPASKMLESNLFIKALKSLQNAVNGDKSYTLETLCAMMLMERVLHGTKDYTLLDLVPHRLAIRHVFRKMGVPSTDDEFHRELIRGSMYLMESLVLLSGQKGAKLGSPWDEVDAQEAEGDGTDSDDSEYLYAEEEDDNQFDNGMDAAGYAMDIYFRLQHRFMGVWLLEVLEIRSNPAQMEQQRSSLIQKLTNAERVLGKVFNNAWELFFAEGTINEIPNENFFLGYNYHFKDFLTAGGMLTMIQLQSNLLRVLYDLYQLGGVAEEAIYNKHRGLCTQVYACVPFIAAVDPTSALKLEGIMLPMFEHASDEELRSLSSHGLSYGGDIEAFRSTIEYVVEAYIGKRAVPNIVLDND